MALTKKIQQKNMSPLEFDQFKLIALRMIAAIFIVGPALAILTFTQLTHIQEGTHTPYLRILIWIDVAYLLLIATLVLVRLFSVIKGRRASRAGSRLHMRLAMFFTTVALVPTVLAAIFATLTINAGLETWFSQKVRNAIGASLVAAEDYKVEQERALIEDATTLATRLNIVKERRIFIPAGDLRNILESQQTSIQRGLKEAYIIDGTGEIRARGARSYLFDYENPGDAAIRKAQNEGLVLIQDWPNSELRALQHLDKFIDRYLYISRSVDSEILILLDETQETVRFYQELEKNRGKLLFEFMLLYLGVAANLVIGATWFGLWFAERLSIRVGQLTEAARQVGTGNFDVRVQEKRDTDEIATLGKIFNQMTEQLKEQRNGLLKTSRNNEERRRLFDSVLSNISAGVIGLDPDGKVEFINQAAEAFLSLKPDSAINHSLKEIAPEFYALFKILKADPTSISEEQIRLPRHRRIEDFLVRARARKNQLNEVEGYVVALDNVSALVLAQRMSAWGDVARRIAHEIKNPLTPIRLSAERIRRNFEKPLGEKGPALTEMTNVIVRQTNDIAHIVNEFSKFSRMPEPVRKKNDVIVVLNDAIALQSTAWEWITFNTNFPNKKIHLLFDQNLLSQAFLNLLKNAAEAIQTRSNKYPSENFKPEIRTELKAGPKNIAITISDNGIGLPADRTALFEPYVSHRTGGTGLGLPIVRKIIEEHGGTLALEDSEFFSENEHSGTTAKITLPLSPAPED